MADFDYIFKREHPTYRHNRNCWLKSRNAYSGGSKYINSALIKHVSEVDLEFNERRKRAYYLNYPRKIARLITHYVLSETPQRRNANSELIEDFSRDDLRVNEVMRQFSTTLNLYGSAWMLIEMPRFKGDVDPSRKNQERLRPYAVAVSPLAVLDWAYGNDGRLLWVLTEEKQVDSSDPFKPAKAKFMRRLWTRTEWFLFEKPQDNPHVKLCEQGAHGLGAVPFVHAVEADGFGLQANHWFEDVVRISDAILNNESEAQMNIVKQMFGLLVISENFARGAKQLNPTNDDSNTSKFSHILARSAAIWESNEEKGISRYIAPSGTETSHIREENVNLKREMFDFVGMAVQKDSKSSQTAESKAWDNQNVRQFLLSRVDILEQVENKCWQLMHAWDDTISMPEVIYNREFSVADLKETMETILGLNSIATGSECKKEINRAAISVLEKVKKISPEVKESIMAEIEESIS